MFYFGGTVPLVIAVLMIFLLPESLQFLVLRGKKLEQRAQVAASASIRGRRRRHAIRGCARRKRGRRSDGAPVPRRPRARRTVLLWIINFMNLLNLYFLSNWLPTVVKDGGYSTSKAVLVGHDGYRWAERSESFVLGWFMRPPRLHSGAGAMFPGGLR